MFGSGIQKSIALKLSSRNHNDIILLDGFWMIGSEISCKFWFGHCKVNGWFKRFLKSTWVTE